MLRRNPPHGLPASSDAAAAAPRAGVRVALACLLLASLAGPGDVLARDQIVRWTIPSEPDVAGYRVYAGPTPGDYTLVEDLGPVTFIAGVGFYIVTGLDDEADAYISLTAYDFGGNESDFAEPLLSSPGEVLNIPTGVLLDEDFEGYGSGAPLADWNPFTYTVHPTPWPFLAVASMGNVSAVTFASGLAIAVHDGPDSGNWQGYDFAGRLRTRTTSGGVGATIYTGTGNPYFLLRGYLGQTFRLVEVEGPGAVGGLCNGKSNTNVPVVYGTWYRFRVRALPLGLLMMVNAKVWHDGEPEPILWSSTCVVPPDPAAVRGAVGLWSLRGGVGPNEWDDLYVDTELVSAPLGAVCDVDADCDDGNVCNGLESCVSRRCRPGSTLDCSTGNECSIGSCSPLQGCVDADLADGTRCGNDLFCDGLDICAAGTCETFVPPACSAQLPCHDATCDEFLGRCSQVPHPEGTPCDAGGVPGTCSASAVCEP